MGPRVSTFLGYDTKYYHSSELEFYRVARSSTDNSLVDDLIIMRDPRTNLMQLLRIVNHKLNGDALEKDDVDEALKQLIARLVLYVYEAPRQSLASPRVKRYLAWGLTNPGVVLGITGFFVFSRIPTILPLYALDQELTPRLLP